MRLHHFLSSFFSLSLSIFFLVSPTTEWLQSKPLHFWLNPTTLLLAPSWTSSSLRSLSFAIHNFTGEDTGAVVELSSGLLLFLRYYYGRCTWVSHGKMCVEKRRRRVDDDGGDEECAFKSTTCSIYNFSDALLLVAFLFHFNFVLSFACKLPLIHLPVVTCTYSWENGHQ